MSDARKTLELLITGKDQASPALKGAKGAVLDLAGSAKSLVGLGVAFAGVQLSAQALRATLGQAFSLALDEGKARAQFEGLIGSADEARKRVSELRQMSRDTPFDFSALADASQYLQRATGGALASQNTMRLIADAAAASGESVSTVARAFGLFYATMRSGQDDGGRAISQLRSLGIISGETYQRIEALAKAGAGQEQVWQALISSMDRYRGAAQRLDDADPMGNFRDAWEDLLRTVGNEALPGLTQALRTLQAEIDRLAANGELRAWGQTLGQTFSTAATALATLTKLITEHKTAIIALGAGYAANKVFGGLATQLLTLSSAAGTAKQSVAGVMMVDTNPELAATLAKVAGAAGQAGDKASLAKTAVSGLSVALGGLAANVVVFGIGVLVSEIIAIKKAADDAAAAVKRIPDATGEYADAHRKGGWGEFTRNILFGTPPPEASPSTATMQNRMNRGQSPYAGDNLITVPADPQGVVDKAAKERNDKREDALEAELQRAAAEARERAEAAEARERADAADAAVKAIEDAFDREAAAAKRAAEERRRALDQIAEDDAEAAQERLQQQIADSRSGAEARIRANEDAQRRLDDSLTARRQTLMGGEAGFKADQRSQAAKARADKAFEARIAEARKRVEGGPAWEAWHGRATDYDRALVAYDRDRRKAPKLKQQIATDTAAAARLDTAATAEAEKYDAAQRAKRRATLERQAAGVGKAGERVRGMDADAGAAGRAADRVSGTATGRAIEQAAGRAQAATTAGAGGRSEYETRALDYLRTIADKINAVLGMAD